MPVSTVTRSEDAFKELAPAKEKGENFPDTVRRLTRSNVSPLEFAGAWKDVPQEEVARVGAYPTPPSAIDGRKSRALRKTLGRA